MANNLLALDQSSRTTGWAVFQDSNLLDSGTFTVTGADIGKRLVSIKSIVLSLLEKYDIKEVVFEDIQVQQNVLNNISTFKILAEVFGVLWETFEELNIPSSAVLSTVWKSYLGIKGTNRAEQKKNAQNYVLNNYKKKVSQDESDAICIGTYKVKKDNDSYDWSN